MCVVQEIRTALLKAFDEVAAQAVAGGLDPVDELDAAGVAGMLSDMLTNRRAVEFVDS